MPYNYSDEEDEIDIHFRRGGRSPAPMRYIDPLARERLERQERQDRAAYYQAATGARLLPNRSGSHHRSRSHTRRSLGPPQGPPVIINNHVDNYYEEDVRVEEEPHRYHYPPQLMAPPMLIAPHHHRSHSRRYSSSRSRSSSSSRERNELEHARRELEKFKMKERAEEEAKALKREMEITRLKEKEKEEREKKERAEAEKKAIADWKVKEEKEKKEREEAEKKAVEEWKKKEEKKKKEKEEEEKKVQQRIEDDMRMAGMSEQAIASVLKKDKGKQIAVSDRPTYTRMARRHISIETLRSHHIEYELDVDPEYVIIKRWVPEYEQDFLWNHTRQIREVRGGHGHGHGHHHQHQLMPPPPPVLVVEETLRPRREEDRLEWVRKKRKSSPSPLLTFFAGGRR